MANAIAIAAVLVILWALVKQASAGTIGAVTMDSSPVPETPQPAVDSVPGSLPQSASLADWAKSILGFESGGSTKARNYSNNNPGNLKFDQALNRPGYIESGAIGQDAKGFAVFPDWASGMDALQRQLGAYVRNHPTWSLNQTMAHYLGQQGDPPTPVVTSEGDPFAYAGKIAGELGFEPGNTLQQIFGS
jgi:hypothetical protein